jgi:hypothetical protein
VWMCWRAVWWCLTGRRRTFEEEEQKGLRFEGVLGYSFPSFP